MRCVALLVILAGLPSRCDAQPTAVASKVSNGVQLFSQLANPAVSSIQLQDDVVLSDTSGIWTPYQPLLVTRNVSISSACSASAEGCTAEDVKLLDFAFLSGLVLMDTGVTVALTNIAVAKCKKAAGHGIDLFLGRQGATLLLENVVIHRLACSPNPAVTVQTLKSKALPGQPCSAVADLLPSFCWRGTCYRDTVVYHNITRTIAPILASPGLDSLTLYGPDADYILHLHHCTRICAMYWPLECVKARTTNYCNEKYSMAALQLQSAPAGNNRAAVIAPIVICGIFALVAASAFLFMWRRRASQRAAGAAAIKQFDDIESSGSSGSPGVVNGDIGAVVSITDGPRIAERCASKWQMLACRTSPSIANCAEPVDDMIRLGVLLGAGVSGRVYRARWRHQDVAVKVMQHDARTATQVYNEVDLMMGFEHINVLKAFHVVTWCESGYGAACNQQSHATALRTASAAAQQGAQDAANSSPHAAGLPATTVGSSSFSGTATPHVVVLHGNMAQLMQLEGAEVHSGEGTPVAMPQEGHSSGMGAGAAAGQGSGSEHVFVSSFGANAQGQAPQEDDSCFNMHGNECMAETWLVLEYCDGGALADLVRAGKLTTPEGKPDMAKVLALVHDVACGMRYLHARNVLHRDLKACNILLVSDPQAAFGLRAKVSDFGLSCAIRPGQTHHSTLTLGTVSHMAPELLRAGKQSPAADVYAFGICMWELVAGRAAFGAAHYGQVFERVAIIGERPDMPPALQEAIGTEYQLLMEACWAAEPSLRPTFEQVCEALAIMQEPHRFAQASVGGCQGGDCAAAASRVTALTSSLSRHWNSVSPPAQEPEERSFDGFF